MNDERMFMFDGVNRSNGDETVRIQVDINPVSGNVEIELSNLVGVNMFDDDANQFEEAVSLNREQFKVFAAALKALAKTL